MIYTEIWDVLTKEQIDELFNETMIMTKVIIYVLLAAIIGWCILDFIMMTKKNKFIRSLNEHDKAIIADYKSIKLIERKKSKNGK